MFQAMGSERTGLAGGPSRNRSRVLPMRRGFVALASVVLAMLGVSSVAVAAPVVTLKVKALPIPGFPGTGNELGAGAQVEVESTISGTEYGGYPSPLTGINLYSPAGAKITPAGFVTCTNSVLENAGGKGCPQRS